MEWLETVNPYIFTSICGYIWNKIKVAKLAWNCNFRSVKVIINVAVQY